MPLSGAASITPAFEHTKQQLFQRFHFGQWSRLALVGMFAGEMSSGGGCNFNVPGNLGGRHRDLGLAAFPDSAAIGALIAVLIVVVPLIWMLFMYISAHMRFVLFESIIAKRCEIRRMWRARHRPSMRYFVWQIVFSLVMIAGAAILVGIPVLLAFLAGWFTVPRDHLAGLILGGVFLFFVFLAWILLSLVVHVFTKDFVVPQMALEEVSAFDGWRRLWPMVKSEKGGYAGYAAIKLALSLGAAIAIGVVSIIVILVLLIPFGGLGAITVLAGQAAGLTWNVFTITAAVVAGCVFLLIAFYAVSLISVPAIVFFPAYSIYFFAARYPQLASLIYPPPPPAPPTPPTIPAPEPIG